MFVSVYMACGAGGATPPGTPERGALSPSPLHDYWPSMTSVSDTDEVGIGPILDYNVNTNELRPNTLP